MLYSDNKLVSKSVMVYNPPVRNRENKKNKSESSDKRSDIPIFTCRYCDEIFIKKSAMYTHVYNMHSTGYACKYCSSVFSNRRTFYNHTSRQHNTDIRKRITRNQTCLCSICGKQFAGQQALHRHEATHGMKKINCLYCPRRFLTERTLACHLATHKKHNTPATGLFCWWCCYSPSSVHACVHNIPLH